MIPLSEKGKRLDSKIYPKWHSICRPNKGQINNTSRKWDFQIDFRAGGTRLLEEQTTISRAERPFSLRHWGSNGSSLSKTTVVYVIVFNYWELSLVAVFSVILLFSLNGIFFVVNFCKRELLSGLETEHVVSLFFWK